MLSRIAHALGLSVILSFAAVPTAVAAQAWSTISSLPSVPPVQRDVAATQDTIRAGRKSGQLSRRDAGLLRSQADALRQRADATGAAAPTEAEKAFLRENAIALRAQVDAQRLQGKH